MMRDYSRHVAIDEMIQEIESGMAQTGIDPDNLVHQAYITVQIELGTAKPDSDYIHNVLAMSLNRPLATRR